MRKLASNVVRVVVAGIAISSSTTFADPGAEVLALEREIAEATVRGDTAYFDRVTSPDFVMIHGGRGP